MPLLTALCPIDAETEMLLYAVPRRVPKMHTSELRPGHSGRHYTANCTISLRAAQLNTMREFLRLELLDALVCDFADRSNRLSGLSYSSFFDNLSTLEIDERGTTHHFLVRKAQDF